MEKPIHMMWFLKKGATNDRLFSPSLAISRANCNTGKVSLSFVTHRRLNMTSIQSIVQKRTMKNTVHTTSGTIHAPQGTEPSSEPSYDSFKALESLTTNQSGRYFGFNNLLSLFPRPFDCLVSKARLHTGQYSTGNFFQWITSIND